MERFKIKKMLKARNMDKITQVCCEDFNLISNDLLSLERLIF